MPIGTVYRPPPRKRSSTTLGSLPDGVSSPNSPSLPAGRAQSDLEARIAEFTVSGPGGGPTSPRLNSNAASVRSTGALPPKPPTSPPVPHRNSAPPMPVSPTQQSAQQHYHAQPPPPEQRQRPTSAPLPPATPPAQQAPPPAPVYPPAVPAQRAVSPVQQSRVAVPSQAVHATSAPQMAVSGKVLIVYYSMYGHVRLLAESVREGIESVPGCSAEIFRVPETLTPDVLMKMNAPQKHNDPELTHEMLYKLREASGVMFGIPTRFGMMPAQMKQMFDSTVKLWTKGDLVGKPAGLFFSSATQGGGQETTALTTITQLVHHGMIYVPPGYSFGGAMFDNSEVHGGSPYGCGTIANGDGTRLPSKYELDFARHQGAQFASIALKLSQ